MTQQQTTQNGTSSSHAHAVEVRRMLKDLMAHARAGLGNADDPKAEALFETTAEVLGGLVKAYDDYGKGDEDAWK